VRIAVRIEPEAEAQVEHLSAWWREYRQAARSLKERLREVFDFIAAVPYAAPVYVASTSRRARQAIS
jgi:hypothetical protein